MCLKILASHTLYLVKSQAPENFFLEWPTATFFFFSLIRQGSLNKALSLSLTILLNLGLVKSVAT